MGKHQSQFFLTVTFICIYSEVSCYPCKELTFLIVRFQFWILTSSHTLLIFEIALFENFL